jgi:hypothetical protein
MTAVEQDMKIDFDQRCVRQWYQNITAVGKKSDFWKKLYCEEENF